MPTRVLKRNDLLYPELSYEIIGCAYEVFNELGSGYPEKYYQRALSIAYKQKNWLVQEQVYFPAKFKEIIIGKNYLDFLIENKIIVEIKKDNYFSKRNIDQVLNYLKVSDLKLAILINFGADGIRFKRIINL